MIEHREYYHEPEPSRQLTRTPSMIKLGSRNPYRRDRSVSARDERYKVDSYRSQDQGRYHEIGTDSTSRGRILRRLVRDRSRSRVSGDEGE